MEKIPLQSDKLVGVDSYHHLYYIKNQTFYKQTETGLLNFKDFQLGRIGSADIINPLKLVLFYPDVQTVVILDNQLTEIQRVNFGNTPYFLNVSGATAANDNRVWIYNQDTQQLELYHYINGEHRVLSGQIAENYQMQKSNFNRCYVLTDKSLRVYNIYGSLIERIENTGIKNFSVSQNKMVLYTGETLMLITENQTQKQIDFPDIRIKDLYLNNELLYLYDGEFLYQLNLTIN